MRSSDSQKVIVVGIPKTLDDAQLSDLFWTQPPRSRAASAS